MHEDILTLHTNRIELRHAKLSHAMETTDDFHVYRVDIKDCDLCVTVDGVAVIQGNGLFTTPVRAGRNRISFGAGSSAATGEAFWDWVRWTEAPITRKPNEHYVKDATHHVIYRQPGLYACFPSLFMDPVSERFFTTFTVKSVASHFPTADTRGVRMASSDGGLTWSEVASIPTSAISDMPGPSFVASDNAHVRIGHYWWRWYPMERLNEFIGRYEIICSGSARGKQTNTFATLSGAYVERSEDGGATWERQEMPELDTYVSGSSPWSMTQLADGTVLRAFMVRWDANCSGRVMVALTHDGRATEVVDVMGDPENKLAFTEETLMHTTSDGTVWLLTRVHGEGAPIWQAVSRDGGRTWEGRPTEIEARQTPPSGLVKLDDGRLALVYGYRYAPSGIRALISEDEGLTWRTDHVLVLRTDGDGYDLGYPRAVKLPDGEILVVYYYATEDKVRHIACTRFTVPSLPKTRGRWRPPSNGWELNYVASDYTGPGSGLPNQVNAHWSHSNYQSANPSNENHIAIINDGAEGSVLAIQNNGMVAKWPNFNFKVPPGAGATNDQITLDFRFRLTDASGADKVSQLSLAVSRPRPDALAGRLRWHVEYAASNNLLPEAAAPAWAVGGFQPGGIILTNDDITGEAALHLVMTNTGVYTGSQVQQKNLLCQHTASDFVTCAFRWRLVDDTQAESQPQLHLSLNAPRPDGAFGRQMFYLRFAKDHISYFSGGGEYLKFLVPLGTDWHELTWTMNLNTCEASVCLDGRLTPSFSHKSRHSTDIDYNFTSFGDESKNIQGIARISYLRLTRQTLSWQGGLEDDATPYWRGVDNNASFGFYQGEVPAAVMKHAQGWTASCKLSVPQASDKTFGVMTRCFDSANRWALSFTPNAYYYQAADGDLVQLGNCDLAGRSQLFQMRFDPAANSGAGSLSFYRNGWLIKTLTRADVYTNDLTINVFQWGCDSVPSATSVQQWNLVEFAPGNRIITPIAPDGTLISIR